ncbi:conserved Plasmodium protein, unknown function [Plasmodium chabaudi chabaudi]|uniref:Uncharacterized protein n=1 Tax=Plasmodium chabaudi chabaudi TaxID=31271 RepID=A0A4V0K3X4_PLACU|nr:conserved Plasmodium protein, unknown function [Plasmodium chabaudi chabaudi]VTZ67259.1 conserved Plasmodium protein, unknown function [Plasmodium chabaudi chabaudi]|eukprot:XP_016653311.1 conserved Plasmodium protein, unknown function [Plasmodium chabaudi chabaudi]
MNSNFSYGNEDEINIIEENYPQVVKLKTHNGVVYDDKTSSNSNNNNYNYINNGTSIIGGNNINSSSHSNVNYNYIKSNVNNNYLPKHYPGNEELNDNNCVNIKYNQNMQHKRCHDFYNNKNSFQHYLKKLKTCGIDADELRNILEKRFSYERDLHKTIQDDDKKGMGSETNSSSSNHDSLHLYRKVNFRNKNNRSKSKNKGKKRKRINAKVDKKFIIKCRTCKFVNPNGFKMGDYYACQNCGYNDFSIIRSISPNSGERND